MSRQVDAITLGVQDLKRSKYFYEEGLGFTAVHDTDDFAAMTLPGVASTLGLYPRDALAADAGVPPQGGGFRATAMSFIVEEAESVDALLVTVRRSGGSVVKPARSQFWGGYTGYVADPDGHLWKVGANHRPSLFRRGRDTAQPATPPSPSETAVTLACRDLKQSKAFYTDGLGFTVDKSYGKFASFKHEGSATMLSLYTWDALADDAGMGPESQGFRGVALSMLVDSDAAVDDVVRCAREAGGTGNDPVHAPWGGYAAYVTDPSGHLWKVAARQ